MAQLFANAARSTLTASITSSSTQLQINPADQALFPVATGADWFKVALEDSSGNLEYMRVQRAVGQSLLTITERATEDATKFPARAFVAGSLVELRMTAADLASSIAHPTVGTGAHAATAISVTPAGGISAATVQAALQELDSEKANASDVTTALTGKASTGANTFTGAQTLPGNASSELQAVPKQQAESIAAAAVLGYERITQIAAKPSTSGTSITFSGADGVPAWAKRVTVSLDLVSTNGADQVCVSLGTAGGIDKAGYQGSSCFIGTSGGVAATIGSGGATLPLTGSSSTRSGRIVFENVGGNVWAFSGQVGDTSAGNVILVAGRKDLGAALTQLAVTTINGTDAFDGGQVTVIYEGYQ